MTNQDFIYNAFFRKNPPSILRLACIQLIREGVNFANPYIYEETWNLIWDRAEEILYNIHRGNAKKLHRDLINQRTGENV
jgi:hypothetical protein